MDTALGYKGELTVYKKYKNKIVDKYTTHNVGQAKLFNFIVECLAGDWRPLQAPKYIGVYYRGTLSDEQMDYQLTPVSSVVKDLASGGETSASVEYTFTISGSNIKTIEGKTGNVVKLFSSENTGRQNSSAEFEFEEGKELQGTQVAAGVSYIVVWKMTISNQAS